MYQFLLCLALSPGTLKILQGYISIGMLGICGSYIHSPINLVGLVWKYILLIFLLIKLQKVPWAICHLRGIYKLDFLNVYICTSFLSSGKKTNKKHWNNSINQSDRQQETASKTTIILILLRRQEFFNTSFKAKQIHDFNLRDILR